MIIRSKISEIKSDDLSNIERGISFKREKNPTLTRPTPQKSNWKGLLNKPKTLLDEWQATALCGNDITSSCLYVAAISTTFAGYLAPLALLAVAGVLFLYRKIYAEVGEALPLNGGAYNCLLNTTTKTKASIAACLTVISYMATAVISAQTSVYYIDRVIGFELPIFQVTAAILIFFAAIVISGIGESAKLALIIFIFHISTLSMVILFGIFLISIDPTKLINNWGVIPGGRSSLEALFLGFSVALLGVSGFESSSNFIEEQKVGVFPKTLRNMWIAVTILNPLIAVVALGILPIDSIISSKKHLLADIGRNMSGNWAATAISINAAIVLCGAVLASFVGSAGLIMRMTLDRCLPQFLLKTNNRGTHHRIVVMFLVLCLSIAWIVQGRIEVLAGVYTIAFLSVMCLFALGNALLKLRRARLPRKTKASWLSITLALITTIIGIAGNIYIKEENLKYFLLYFLPTTTFVLITLYRQNFLKIFLIIVDDIMTSFAKTHQKLKQLVGVKIVELQSQGIMFFTKGDNVASLNRAMLYVRENENTNHITVMHILEADEHPPERLFNDLRLIDEIYPELKIELVVRRGKFGPALINELANEYNIAPNYMFLGTPGDQFPYRISDLGGVRVII